MTARPGGAPSALPANPVPSRSAATEVAIAAGALADEWGLTDLAIRLRAGVPTADPALPVVVATAEVSCGKSSLVNALVGRPLLSPVGDDVVTATYVVLIPGERDHAVAVVVDPRTGLPKQVSIGLDELADYVSVDAVYEGVISAVVHLTSPALRGFTLVDTPGVGGLAEAHTSITRAALDGADALLFIMDAEAPLSLPELRFLADAVRRNCSVVLAMTKTDLYPAWADIREDNLTLIAQHVPQLAEAPILPVSSRLAVEAGLLEATNPAVAEQVRRASGVSDLLDSLHAAIARPRTGTPDDHVDRLGLLLGELRERLGERSAARAGGTVSDRTIRAERERLEQFLSDPHQGAFDMRRRIERVRRDCSRDFTSKATTLLAEYRQRLESASASELRELPTLLRSELARLVADSIGALDGEFGVIVDTVQDRIGSVAVLQSVREQLGQDVETDISEHRPPTDWLNHLVAAAGSTTGAAGTLVVAGVFAASGPPGLAALAVAALATEGVRLVLAARTSTRQQGLRTWLDRVARDIEASFSRAADARAEAMERVLEVELPRLLRDRIGTIDRVTSILPRVASRSATADVDALLARLDASDEATDR